MTLARGRPYLAIPGPSVSPERVLLAMHRSSPNIYKGELHEMLPGILDDLKAIARTRHHLALYVANGHGGWEAGFANVLSPGDRVLMLRTGSFGDGWSDVARRLGAEVEILDFGRSAGLDPERLRARLAQPDAGGFRAVCLVHADTSSGLLSDPAEVRAALDAAGLDALFLLDCIASFACDATHMDDWGVDVLITASQKGLMTPPGMALVFFSDRADAARETARAATHYWDWRPRVAPEIFYHYFDGTAPTHHLYGLRAALDMIFEEGLEAVHRRHGVLARAIWAAVDHWGTEGPLRLNVADPARRSTAVTSVDAGSPRGTALRDWCETEAGLTLGIGLGVGAPGSDDWHRWFRIGHMGYLSPEMVLGLVATVEAGLIATGIDHAPGGAAAAAGVIAAA